MKRTLFVGSALFIFFIMGLSNPINSVASGVVGDVNDNGKVGLEEGIYALQVAAGLTPATILDASYGPNRAAWGTYILDSNTLNLNITFSNFDNAGPPIGNWAFSIPEISPTSINLMGRTWIRALGEAGDIVGKWEFTDADNNVETLVLDSNGAMLYTAKGPMFTEVVEVETTFSIEIDGNFTDWAGISELDLYNNQSDCNSGVGRKITNISMAQDDEYIYVKMTLDGLPDSTFTYQAGDDLFKIWVSPPPSLDCGFRTDIGNENTGVAQFGTTINNDNVLECRVNKCLVKNAWNKAGYDIKASQSGVCRSTSNISLLKFDFSTCP